MIARLAGFAMRLRRVQRAAFRTVSQTGIHYREGPLSKTASALPGNAPQAGDRFPWLKLVMRSGAAAEDLFATLDDTRFHLLAFGQPVPAQMSDCGGLVQMHAVPTEAANEAALAAAKIPRPSFYLVRPDGYIGLCGGALDADAVARYVRETLHLG